jgi:predicted translin family RNA/ssDNA-binding protein
MSSQALMTKSDLSIVTVSEYVNGLADFTGEIGRLAVIHGSERHLEPVQLIQQLDLVIYEYITKLNIYNNGNYSKKLDMISTNSKKIDDLIYELTLLKASGKFIRLMPVVEPAGGGGNEKKNENTEDDGQY